jgi:hypothetical protein
MKIFNRHDRIIPAEQDAVGSVLNSLSGPEDALWPREVWPPMVLDSALKVGAAGGHSAVRYRVSLSTFRDAGPSSSSTGQV